MLSKHTYFIVAGSGIFVIVVVFSLIQLIQKNHYKIITDNDVNTYMAGQLNREITNQNQTIFFH